MDEQKKMFMIGGVVALAVVVIIAAAVIHKKKVFIVPATTTAPIQKKNYIRSSDGNYLILEKGYKISSTPDYTQATPIVKVPRTFGSLEFYPLMTESGKYILMTNNYVNYADDVDNNILAVGALVLASKTYPTDLYDLYLWPSDLRVQPSLVVGTEPNKSFSVVYV